MRGSFILRTTNLHVHDFENVCLQICQGNFGGFGVVQLAISAYFSNKMSLDSRINAAYDAAISVLDGQYRKIRHRTTD